MKLFPREKYLRRIRGFYDAADIIKVITGVRRCGKSSLMMMIADEIREKGVDEARIIFLNLDQRGYRKIRKPDQLEELIENRIKDNNLHYLFIDEIQNVKGFEEVINGFREDGNCSIFITGSNSYLLSGELVTKLTGRYLEFEMYTLTFEEYEKIKGFYGKAIDSNPAAELRQYILEGGFPRAILFDSLADKQSYTQGVTEEIYEKDIRRRIKVRTRESFEAIRTYIINNFGATTSIANLYEDLRKNGQKISRQTVTRYIKALIDAKVLYECNRFDMKSRKSLTGEKKYYISDLSFYYSRNTDNQIHYGPVLENIVYFYARSMNNAVSVGRIGKLECDFLIRNPDMNYSYVQVAYTILSSKETEDREYRSLELIRDNYPKYVMTTDYLLQHRNGIIHVNLLDFIKEETQF
ncbi:MAG: ATP-binding protein [Anaerolineaceae bacterium]|nr:ATP-binding protein [Anaerolineaceae bacterium]MBR6966640.1 ATP-binding protein [Clostridia bacterium]